MANLNEIGDLLEKIAIHYPAFGKQIQAKDGSLRKDVCEEWQRIIGYLSYEDLIERFDRYMEQDDSHKAPLAMDFRKVRSSAKKEYFHYSDPDRVYHLVFPPGDVEHRRGRVFDEEDREYVHDPTYEGHYHYNKMGQIVTDDGLVAF